MNLFSFEQTDVIEKESGAVMEKTRTEIKDMLGKRYEKVGNVIGKITMGESIHYASMGEWSNHDLLAHLIEQVGPVDFYFATWSVSAAAVDLLLNLIESGKIKSLHAVLDWRVKVRRPEILGMMKFNFSTLRLTSCHAKTFVIENDKWQVAVVGSANFTNNPRIEAGVIACDPAAANFHRHWIMAEYKNAHPFED